MTAVDPPGWITRFRQAEARRGERCRNCGVRAGKTKLIETEVGWFCRAHEQLLSPRIHRRDESSSHAESLKDLDQDVERMDDIREAERRAALARARLKAVRRGATLSDGAAIIDAERGLQRALNTLAAAWAARINRDDGDAA